MKRLCSDIAAAGLAVAALPLLAAVSAQALYCRLLRRLNRRRWRRERHRRFMAAVHVQRTAEAIVADHAALWAGLYDTPTTEPRPDRGRSVTA
ncbi:hypothetical protein [Streptomyces sp. NPDC017529]|uniref:hypothetical protein n=1 Tax=Streptomyces sp. NPDC017529 TaxID=3365000 RepID=UPI0037B03AD5